MSGGTMHEELEAHLVEEEGEVLHVYQDHLGFWTLGVGRLVDPRRGGGISREESRYLLANDIAEVEAGLDRAIPWWRGLSDSRRLVLASMAFQLGIDGLLGFRNTLTAIKRGDYAAGARGMLASKWARRDTPARAKRMAALMERG